MNDMKGIMEAQTARGVEFDSGSLVKKVRLMVPLCIPLLVSSVRRGGCADIYAIAVRDTRRTPRLLLSGCAEGALGLFVEGRRDGGRTGGFRSCHAGP